MKPTAINQKAILTENRKRILRLLTSKRELTILEISRELDISIPTIVYFVEDHSHRFVANHQSILNVE